MMLQEEQKDRKWMCIVVGVKECLVKIDNKNFNFVCFHYSLVRKRKTQTVKYTMHGFLEMGVRGYIPFETISEYIGETRFKTFQK